MQYVRFTGWMCAIALLAALTGCQEATTDASKSTTKPAVKPLDPPAIPDDAPEFTETDSGLKYRILRDSDGKKPTVRSRIVAHYRGWLDDGTEFDSSYKRGEPLKYPLINLVDGWIEGLQLIGEGGMIELDVPPDLGYGSQGKGLIPPNAQLHFILELIEVH